MEFVKQGIKSDRVYWWGILSFILILLLCGCEDAKQIRIVGFVHHDFTEYIDSNEQIDVIDYDSVTFSDGSYVIQRTKFAPINSLTQYFNKEGKLIATLSNPSENYSQILVYRYDKHNRLTHFLRYRTMFDSAPFYYKPDYEYLDSLENVSDSKEEYYLNFRRCLEKIDFYNLDTINHTVTEIVYDDKNTVHHVCERASGRMIQAPKGYKLNVNVKPCQGFWTNDLNGGRFFFHVDIVPDSDMIQTYFIKCFVDFIPTVEMYYEKGILMKIVCHSNPRSNYPQWTKIRKEEDEKILYMTRYENDCNVYVSVWQAGRLQEFYIQSKYGTLLKKVRYNYFSLNRVEAILETIDYRTNKLKFDSKRLLNVSDLESEVDEMNPFSFRQNNTWMDVY